MKRDCTAKYSHLQSRRKNKSYITHTAVKKSELSNTDTDSGNVPLTVQNVSESRAFSVYGGAEAVCRHVSNSTTSNVQKINDTEEYVSNFHIGIQYFLCNNYHQTGLLLKLEKRFPEGKFQCFIYLFIWPTCIRNAYWALAEDSIHYFGITKYTGIPIFAFGALCRYVNSHEALSEISLISITK